MEAGVTYDVWGLEEIVKTIWSQPVGIQSYPITPPPAPLSPKKGLKMPKIADTVWKETVLCAELVFPGGKILRSCRATGTASVVLGV